MGRRRAYQIATRLQQVTDRLLNLNLNQGEEDGGLN